MAKNCLRDGSHGREDGAVKEETLLYGALLAVQSVHARAEEVAGTLPLMQGIVTQLGETLSAFDGATMRGDEAARERMRLVLDSAMSAFNAYCGY